MEGNPVGWFEIYVEDMGRAKQFYETVFQVSLRKLNIVIRVKFHKIPFVQIPVQFPDHTRRQI